MSYTPAEQAITLLMNTRRAMNEAKAIITAHIDRDPDGFLKWSAAENEVVELLASLERAPALELAPPQPPVRISDLTARTAPEFLLKAADAALANLLKAAERAEGPADMVACLRASLHAGRLLHILR
ncbi:hypothetical protein [Actinomadura hibisca]|uniref:hypothetical protein n=1 Tax=Actinomadura hibisca TaxID=68565 RepID=UPI00082F8607|nr:hypothetical protein [Actinomadura hibisca]